MRTRDESGADSPLTVLIADDEPGIRRLMSLVLTADSIDVVGEAADGREAVDVFRALRASRPPSVVILDNRMPGLSGLGAAAEILRDDPGQLIILITASIDDQLRAEATRLGIARALAKRETTGLAKIVRALVGVTAAALPTPVA